MFSKLSKYRTGAGSRQSEVGTHRPKSCFSGRAQSISTANQRMKDPKNTVAKELLNELHDITSKQGGAGSNAAISSMPDAKSVGQRSRKLKMRNIEELIT